MLARWALPLSMVLLLGLTGCSPTYDWREVDLAAGAVRAAFPGRVQQDTREISLDGQLLRFTLTTARAGGAIFAVGYAPWPGGAGAADPAMRARLKQALLRSLYDNVAAGEPPAAVPSGEEVELHGTAAGKPVWLLARVWALDTMLLEAVAAGPQDELPFAPAREFVRAVRVRPGG